MGAEVTQDENGVWVGTAENNHVVGTSNDDTYNLGGLNDEIEFDISGNNKIGTNRVILSEDEILTINFKNDTNKHTFDVGKSGKNDVLVTIYNDNDEIGKIIIEDPYRDNFAADLMIRSQNGHLSKNFFDKFIDKSNAKKGQTIKGSFWNEHIEGSKKADKIYTGNGKDTIDPGKGNDKIFVNGKGKKTIEFGENTGNNTIVFSGEGKEATTTLSFSSLTYNRYRKTGKNLYIDSYNNYTDKKLSTNTVTNVFDNTNLYGNVDNIVIEKGGSEKALKTDVLTNSILDVYGDKKRMVQGTNYDDYLHGSKKADTIKTGIGDDTVNGGKGNDKIYLDSTGDKTVVLNNGDGNDTIYLNSFTENINFIVNGADDIRTNSSTDGKDLIIYRTSNIGKAIKTEATTIKDFYQYWKYGDFSGNANLYINDTEYHSINFREENKNLVVQMTKNYTIDSSVTQNKFFGTKKADTVTVQGSGSSKMIFTGAGNDTINVNNGGNTVSAGAGNDTININTEGTTIINHTTGDGNDTITASSTPSLTINLRLQGSQFNRYDIYYSNYFIAMRQGFSMKGNDLVMQIPAGMNKFETITFKDYFSGGSYFDEEKIYIHSTVNEYVHDMGTLEQCFGNWAFWATGQYDETEKRTIYQSMPDHYNYFYYNGKGKATMLAETGGDDIYLTTINKKSNLIITDNGGTSDKLYINGTQSNLRVFFNVDKYGSVYDNTDGISDDLFIFNKSSLTAKNLKKAFDNNGSGFMRINNFFKNGENQYTKGDGFIESMFLGKNITNYAACPWEDWHNIIENQVKVGAMVDVIAEKVAGWLNNHTGYYDTMDVINSGNSKDINSLLKIYQSTEIFLNKNLT